MRSFLILLVAGCGQLAAAQGEALDDTVRAFNDDMTWAKFDVAAAHLPPAQRVQFIDDWEDRSKDLHVTGYTVVKVVQKGATEARVEVKLEWYKESEGTVHETYAQQIWERHGKLWLLVDEARLRGPEMPGLLEPMMKDVQATK
ncbi:MAG TPA: hypothetical protein VLX92_32105 [Kofleriaceae bacterium]|nr:hypothetical protein [Kofleriaceae bacterium]